MNAAARWMGKRLQAYEAAGITVTFDPNVCAHSGVCVRGLPEVFDVHRSRAIAKVVARSFGRGAVDGTIQAHVVTIAN